METRGRPPYGSGASAVSIGLEQPHSPMVVTRTLTIQIAPPLPSQVPVAPNLSSAWKAVAGHLGVKVPSWAQASVERMVGAVQARASTAAARFRAVRRSSADAQPDSAESLRFAVDRLIEGAAMPPELAALCEQVMAHVERDDADHAEIRQWFRATAKALPDIDFRVVLALYDEHVKAVTSSHDRLVAALDDFAASL